MAAFHSLHFQHHRVARPLPGLRVCVAAGSHTFGYRRAVEVGIVGQVGPVVVDMVSLAAVKLKPVRAHHPLVPGPAAVFHHAVVVVNCFRQLLVNGYVARPLAPLVGVHGDGLVAPIVVEGYYVQRQLFTIAGVVVNVKM